MNKIYVINGRLIFHTKRNELVSQIHSDIKETLNAPCARCLEILLSTPGQIISQAELYKAGWGEKWKEVSPNTLYQNVLLARKALRNVSESDDEYIITVPRKGFKFNEDISVTESKPSDQSENMNASVIIDEHTFSGGHTLSYLLFRLLNSATCILLLLAAIVFKMGSYIFDNTYHQELSEEYTYYQTRSGCDLYLNKRKAFSGNETEKLLEMWPEMTSGCGRLPVRYITPYRSYHSVFYLACDSKNKAGRTCKSGYLRLSE